MLNITRSIFCGNLYRSLAFSKFFFSVYDVKEVRGDYLMIVEDKASQLQYMREVVTSDGKSGIVLKIEHPSNAYIALYEPIKSQAMHQLHLDSINIPWQKSVEPIIKEIILGSNSSLFNVNGHKLFSRAQQVEKQPSSDRKLHSLSPILEICNELKYGDMIQFSGCLGSRKTTTSLNIANNFAKIENHASIFVNLVSESESKRAVNQAGCWSMTAGSQKNQTDVGVYMMAVKIVHLAEKLMKAGLDVLLTFDGFRHAMHAQWHMIQLLSNNFKHLPGQLSFKAPRLPPIAVMNEIYANCMDNGPRKKGSLTAILTTENKSGDQLSPEVTPYSNNIKHLNSLAKTVTFPLTFKHASASLSSYSYSEQDLPPVSHCILQIRRKVNEYLVQKRDTELKRKLYKSDMNDAPWDYYKLLDAQWWMTGLQSGKISTLSDLQSLFYWIWLNIDLQFEAHWKIGCIEAFGYYKKYLDSQNLKIGRASLLKFTGEAKLEGLFGAFKKDYLK